MNFAAIKAMSRRAVHEIMAVPCFYSAPDDDTEIELTARLHDRIMVGGATGGDGPGYATIIEGVTRAIFNREELEAAGVTLRKRGRVTFPDYEVTLQLDIRDPYEGMILEKWSVAPL